MRKFNLSLATKTVKELKELAKAYVVKGYSKMKKDTLVEELSKFEKQLRQEEYKKAFEAEVAKAKDELGEDYSTCYAFYRNLKGRKLKLKDIDSMVSTWKLLTYLVGNENIVNASLDDIANYLRGIFAPAGVKATDISSWSDDTKKEFIGNMLNGFVKATTTERLTKENVKLLKFSYQSISFSDNGEISFDSSQAIVLDDTKELANLEVAEKKDLMRWVATSEDGCTRILAPLGKQLISICLDTSNEDEEEAVLLNRKFLVLRNGLVDKATGKHYRFCLQTASGKRKANYLFVEADTEEEVFQIWFELTGTKDREGFYKAFGRTPSISKMNTRISSRASNSFNPESSHTAKEIEEIRNMKVLYISDAKVVINRPYKTITGPGVMELVENKSRDLKPGDGQITASIQAHAKEAKYMRLITTTEYEDFCRLWIKCGRDMEKAKNEIALVKILRKIPGVFQIRQGADKGISVWFNYENITITLDEETVKMLNKRNKEQFVVGETLCLGDFDMLIPDSVRKFVAGEWSDYPLEICNFLKRKKGFVNLNQQFINALDVEPDALESIADYWIEYAKDSLKDNAKAMVFHNIVFDEDNNENQTTPMPKALRTNEKLAKDAQVLKWRKAPYEKLLNDMLQGRIKVPGMYTYMVADPAYVISNVFGIDIPCLQSGENYFNNKNCNVGAFRAPLIAQQNAQKLPVVEVEEYWYMKDVLVFNGFDGQWESMQGADFDGDTCGVIPDDNEFGKTIVDGIVDKYDLYEEGFPSINTPFDFDDMDPYYQRLAEDANRDDTGKMTNFAVKSQEIANHLVGAVRYAKRWGLDKIVLKHPKEYGYNADTESYFGSDVKPTINRAQGTLTVRGLVEVSWNKRERKFEFDDGIVGTFTLDEVLNIAQQYVDKCEYTSPLVARAIDCAKTAVDARGLLYCQGLREGKTAEELEPVNEFVDSIKTIICSSAYITKNKLKGKEITFKDKINTYVSLSPLGRLHAYVEKRKNEVLDMFKDDISVNLNSYLLTLLTEKEHEELYKPLQTKSSGTKNIIQCLEERRKDYNRAIHNLNTISSEINSEDREDETDSIQIIKDKEIAFFNRVANYYDISLETIAVACYICAYSRDTTKSLTYGWLLEDTLLSVFSRGNEKFFNVPVKSTDLYIIGGWLYEDGKRRMPVHADDTTYVPVIAGTDRLFAHIKKKVNVVVDNSNRSVTVSGNATYTLKALGFKYHSTKTPMNWLNTVVANGNEFEIKLNSEGRLCAFVGEESISMIEYGKSFELLNKIVKVINQPQLDDSSIRDIQVVVIG